MIKKLAIITAGLTALSGSPALAAVDLVIEGGGTPIVFQGDNGNRFGVLGIDARRQDSDSIVNLSDFVVDTAFIRSLIAPASGGGARLENAFFCSNFGSANCSPLTSVSVADESRLFGSLLLEFNGTGNVVFQSPNTGRTASLNLAVTQQGLPPINVAGAVPEPTTWVMMLLGFFGMGAALRIRSRKTGRTTLSYA